MKIDAIFDTEYIGDHTERLITNMKYGQCMIHIN